MSVHPRMAWTGLTVLLPLGALVLFLLAPGSLDEKMHHAMSGLCAQRPAHTIFVDGRPLALEARMLGIYVGFAVAVLTAWLGSATRRSDLPRGPVGALITGGIVWMALDGINAWVYDVSGPALYPPDNGVRLWTGLLCGLGIAGYVMPAIAVTFWRERDRRPLFATGWELLRAVLALAAVGIAVWYGLGGATLLSALTVVSVAAGFWLLNTYFVTGAWVGDAKAVHWRELGQLATVGFALAVIELAALAALRPWLEQTYGITWPI